MTPQDPKRNNGVAPENGVRRSGRPHARDAVAAIAETDLTELFRFWSGKASTRMPEEGAAIRQQVLEWMSDPATVEARAASLGKRLTAVLDLHLASARYQAGVLDLLNAKSLAYLSRYDLEAGLSMLVRHGLLVEVPGPESPLSRR